MTWGSELVDVAAYLRRIGHTGPTEPTADTLRALHRAHAETIPFENVDVLLRRPIELDLESVQDKLVGHRRGGYCYEQNILFSAVLERLGFTVDRLVARLYWGEQPGPRSHAALRVRIGDQDWLADTGFGGEGLLAAIPLASGTEVAQGDWHYRIEERPYGGRALCLRRPDGWAELYTVLPDPQQPLDYRIFSHYTATHPRSPFLRRLLLQRRTDTVRTNLDGTELTITGQEGVRQKREIDRTELGPLLAGEFGIDLPAEDLAQLAQE